MAKEPGNRMGVIRLFLWAVAIIIIVLGIAFLCYAVYYHFAHALGWFSIRGDARSAQSVSYWRFEAKPFAILEHSQSNGSLIAIVQNVENRTRTMRYFAAGSSANDTLVWFSPGEKKQISLAMNEKCAANSTYDLNVTFGYDNGMIQKGMKNLIGKCH